MFVEKCTQAVQAIRIAQAYALLEQVVARHPGYSFSAAVLSDVEFPFLNHSLAVDVQGCCAFSFFSEHRFFVAFS